MLKWLLSSILDRILVGLALFLACIAWWGQSRNPARQVLALTDEVRSPFEQILRALD